MLTPNPMRTPLGDPYASHLPVVHALGRILKPRRVLEFGGGPYSTLALLDSSGLEQLVTVETDPGWRMWLEGLNRRQLLVVDALHDWYLDSYDLILIDNGPDADHRRDTIRWIAGQRPPCPVVIHDYEVYRPLAAQAFEHEVAFSLRLPHTGIVWFGHAFNEEALAALRCEVEVHASPS